jgi:hypothetical protein
MEPMGCGPVVSVKATFAVQHRLSSGKGAETAGNGFRA